MKRIATGLTFLAACLAPSAHAAAGEVLATFDIAASRFLMSTTRPVMYASVPSINSVVAIDTTTLSILSTTFVGSNPKGMALSNDGSRLYVANSGSNFIGVLDTSTGALINRLAVPEVASDVEVGKDGRLFVLGTNNILQVDPNSGASVGPNLGPWWAVYSGEPGARGLVFIL